MIPEKRKPVIIFFGLIYLIFGAFMLYLLFFNTGLDIVAETSEKEIKVFLQNNSVHLIRDINVLLERENGETLLIDSIKALKPREKIQVQLPSIEKEKVTIIAIAPFHARISKDISIERTKGAKLNFEIAMQSTAFVEIQTSIALKVCNQGDTINDLKIVEVHSPDFFEEQAKTDTVAIPENECKKIDYALTPKKTGQTTIYFKFTALNVNQELERSITIMEK